MDRCQGAGGRPDVFTEMGDSFDDAVPGSLARHNVAGAMYIVGLASPALAALRLTQMPLLWQLYVVRACLVRCGKRERGCMGARPSCHDDAQIVKFLARILANYTG